MDRRPFPCNSFYFVRHGETDWNRQGLIMGQTDIPLNATGIAQANEVASWLRHHEITTIITSPLQRAVQTTEFIAATRNSSIIIMDEFKECHFGTAQGTRSNPTSPWYTNWQQGLLEGAESYQDFTYRVTNGLHLSLAMQGPVLIVAHRGVYHIIQEILKLGLQWTPNSAVFHHKPPIQPMYPWIVTSIPAAFDNEI